MNTEVLLVTDESVILDDTDTKLKNANIALKHYLSPPPNIQRNIKPSLGLILREDFSVTQNSAQYDFLS